MFTETNSSELMYESIKTLGSRTSIVLNLAFPSNIILSCLVLLFFIIDLYFLTPVVIAQLLNSTAELAIPIRTPTNQANLEIEIQPLTAEIKTKKMFAVIQSPENFSLLFTLKSLCFFFI